VRELRPLVLGVAASMSVFGLAEALFFAYVDTGLHRS
jgi:hypothetical protein